MAAGIVPLLAVLCCLLQISSVVCVTDAEFADFGKNGETIDSGTEFRRGLSYQDFVNELDDDVAKSDRASEKRSQTGKVMNDEEIKTLKVLVEQQQKALEEQNRKHKAEMQSVMQQIDALVTQSTKTLKLVGSQSSGNGGLKIGTQSSGSKVAEVVTTGGVHYIRWGRNRCPPTSVELYRGYTAGTPYNIYVGGVNTLCLHEYPEWGSYSDGAGSSYSIYGSEYYFTSTPFSTKNNALSSFSYHDVPCIACHSPVRSSNIMIPGRKECPTGWTLEYQGYLVTNYGGTYTRGDFICLDGEPETQVSGHQNQQSMFLTPVKASCGSLPCPRYVNGRQITCIVCTK